MRKQIFTLILATIVLCGAGAVHGARPLHDGEHLALDLLPGVWAINFLVPVSPKGNDLGQPHRHPFTFKNENGQRTVQAMEVLDIRVPGAWRATGEEFSASFELTCPTGLTCGTIVLRGNLESDTSMRGRVAIFWDEADETTETGLDTVTGTFTGEKCTGARGNFDAQHDTGGCESVRLNGKGQ
jgi:hypothetical protein